MTRLFVIILVTSKHHNRNQQVTPYGAPMRPPCVIGGSPPFSRRGAATATVRVRRSVRPSPPIFFLLPPLPLRLSVRSFRGVAHSPLFPRALALSLSPRSLVRPLSPIIVARSFVRSLASIVPLNLTPVVRSFILTASNAVPFSLSRKIETFLPRICWGKPFSRQYCIIGPALSLDAGRRLGMGSIHNLSACKCCQ